MLGPKFSKEEAIKYGWRTTVDNFFFFVIIVLVTGVINYGPAIFNRLSGSQAKFNPAATVFFVIICLVFWILNIIVSLGLMKISLKFVDNQKPDLNDLFKYYPLFFKYFVSSLLYGLIVLGGLILLVVPGIIWAIKYQFYGYYIVEGAGIMESIKKSGQLTTGVKWDLLVFDILLCLINLLGVAAFFIGLFFTIPLTLVALADVYRRLQRSTEVPVPPLIPTPPTVIV